MGLDSLNGKSWWQISRDERYFCAELFRMASTDISGFVRAISSISGVPLLEGERWEMAVEVCFYRDYFWGKEPSESFAELSQKRTFDICLFSDKQVVIIEAKANQRMPLGEAEEAKKDKETVSNILRHETGRQISINLLALVSSRYRENHNKRSENGPLKCFDGVVTWKQLYAVYGNEILSRADDLYRN